MEGTCALIIAILGCEIKEGSLMDGEALGMRRYPISAEDAFKCYEGKKYTYESRKPESYNYGEKFRYATPKAV